MKKSKLFIILVILTIISLLATAALCNMCQFQPVQTTEDENTKDDSSKTTESKKTDSNTSSAETPDSNKKDDSKQAADKDIDITDIVIGIVTDEHVEPESVIYTDSTYTCYPVFATPVDGKEKYDWSVSGGSNDNSAFYMQWNTPLDEGTYSITINVTRDDGSTGKFTRDVLVELPPLGEPPKPPTIVDIRIYVPEGEVDDGHYYTNKVYKVVPMVDGANELIDNYGYSFSAGTVLSSGSGIFEWQSPDVPGDVTINIDIRDSSGNIIDEEIIVITIEL